MMEDYKKEAEKWVESPGTTFILSKVNEEERELEFHGKLESNSSINFKITYPSTDNLEHFTVSSEDDDVSLRLFEVNDILAVKKSRTLSEILNIVQVNLCPENAAKTKNDFEEDDLDDSGAESNEESEDEYNSFVDEDVERVTTNPHESITIPDDEDDVKLNMKYSGSTRPSMAVSRLMTDYKQLKKSAREGNIGISGGPRGDNLFVWDVQLTGFDSNSRLGIDMARYAKNYNEEPALKLEMEFPPTYPMAPPFLRVLKPRFEFLTGHVTIGGSICMELLTRSGWSPSNDIESILVQVRAEIMSDTNARLHKNPNVEYSAQDARNAFKRMTMKYGWD